MGASGTVCTSTRAASSKASAYSRWKTARRLVFERGSKTATSGRPGEGWRGAAGGGGARGGGGGEGEEGGGEAQGGPGGRGGDMNDAAAGGAAPRPAAHLLAPLHAAI